MYSFFPCIPIFRWFFSIESVKRMCICDYVKIALLLVKNVFFSLKKSISEFLHWVAQKHTANNYQLFDLFKVSKIPTKLFICSKSGKKLLSCSKSSK